MERDADLSQLARACCFLRAAARVLLGSLALGRLLLVVPATCEVRSFPCLSLSARRGGERTEVGVIGPLLLVQRIRERRAGGKQCLGVAVRRRLSRCRLVLHFNRCD